MERFPRISDSYVFAISVWLISPLFERLIFFAFGLDSCNGIATCGVEVMGARVVADCRAQETLGDERKCIYFIRSS